MPSRTWTLTDVSRDIHQSPFCIGADDLPSAKGQWKVTQRTLHGGLSEGVELVEVNNGRLRLFVLPTRGMGIWHAKIGDDQTLGWQSPVQGPVHPMYVPLTDPSGLGWLEGFDEFIVRCGLESNGAPEFDQQGRLVYPLHGRIANRPAHHVEVTVDDSATTLTLRGIVEETRFHFQKLRLTTTLTTTLGSTSFTFSDQVENFGGMSAQMQMLYHINFGEPLLVPGARIVAPVRSIERLNAASKDSLAGWEIMGPPVAGSPEECYLLKLLSDEAGRTQVLLKNSQGTEGAALTFNTNQLPCFTVWKNMVSSKDGYVTGLEPGTNFPNKRSVEADQGRVISLSPGETWNAEIVVDWLTTRNEVDAVEDAIRYLTESADKNQ